ncbi:GNAT family N-acetyltransferase [Vibrio navarrensis]|uniref:GNAT family N-acetyltransferase n=1 Tax=Vibrio navarrensis TaxID=29495 RepID=UPI00186A8CBC|nr:GNAT family N-acetyltransferase [Vibrio navarrensis]QOD69859.1 GNAT family N-acetyltransferase [Vibrio navarrensis]
MLISKLDVKEIKELERFLHKVDEDFQPTLSSRVDIKNYAQKLICNAIVFKAYKASNTIGLVACYANDSSKKNAYIPFIAVDRDFRGYGIGGILLNKLLFELKKNNFKNLSLTVRKNSDAFYLYKKIGFKIDYEFKYKNTDIVGVNMVKKI